MTTRIWILTPIISLSITLGISLFGFVPSAQAEIIEMEGESPCPHHNPDHTSWSDNHGCTCDAGWSGPSCNIAGGPGGPGTGDNPADATVGGEGGGPSNPILTIPFSQSHGGFFKTNQSTMRTYHFELPQQCKDAAGTPVKFIYHGGPTVYCDMPEPAAIFGSDRVCAFESTGLWHCMDATPTLVRIADRYRPKSSTGTSAPKPRRRPSNAPRPRTGSGAPAPRSR